MWDKLDRADLDRARQELRFRRAETVRRHEEELCALDAERAEVDALNQLIGAFAEKYRKASSFAVVSDSIPIDEPSPGIFQNFVAA